MKKYINISFIYAISALACGVFYREFTKFFEFSGKTTLSFTHSHLFLLGTIVFLLVSIFSCLTNLTDQKYFKIFMILYNIGLPFIIVMFFIKGIFQVIGTELSTGVVAAISGLSGISHIIIAVGIVFLFLSLRKSIPLKK